MTHSSRWLLVLSVSALASGAMTCLYAQDDLEALLQDLGGQKKPAAAKAAGAAQAETKKTAEATKPAEAEKPAAVVAPKPAEDAAKPAVPAVAEKPAVTPTVKPAEEAVPVAKKPTVEEKPAEVAPAPAAAVAAEKPAETKPAETKPDVAPTATVAVPAVAPAAAKPAEKPAAVAAASDNDQSGLVSELLTLETIRRKSLDDHGYASLEVARKALRDGDYTLARDQYKQALDFIGNRPATAAARQEASTGIAEAFYRDAKLAMKKGDYDKAMPLAVQAQEHGHPQAARLIETLKKEPAKTAADNTSISHRVNDDEYKMQRDDTRRHLRRSRQFYATSEYDKALEECELVLRDVPYDKEALELRDRIADRMKNVADVEFEATRSLMIRDVRKTWTPDRYAIESSQMPKGKSEMTSKQPVSQISGTKTSEQIISQKLREIVIPEVTFRPPATIIDAVDFFKQASRDYDNPEIPVEQRGVNLVLKLAPRGAAPVAAPAADNADPFATPSSSGSSASGVPQISALSARFINLYDALKLVCDVTGMKFRIRGNIVMIVPINDPDDELVTRSYNVLATLQERVGAASSEMNANGGGKSGGKEDNTFMEKTNMDTKQDWKAFFSSMGVQWPDGSSISYLSTIGKLRVTNTAENLAVFEQVLEDLNVTPRLIEIEARFVEVSQSDLNSLGFEWLLNSDYSFGVGGALGKALNLQKHSNTKVALTDAAGNALYDANGNALYGYQPYQSISKSSGTETAYYTASDGSVHATTVGAGQYVASNSKNNNMSINTIDGSTYSTGQRYLNTTGNPISGTGSSTDDQFMKINAFLGSADLSMILHMLSQRSDTDLLSAPKVVTKSGQEAVMKVVTEYIYPTEYQVQISQQSTSSSITSGSSGDPLAIVEPQNFEMREVGVILQCVPEVSAEGQMINLVLTPQVVGEPTWKNYGTKVPKTTYRSPTAEEKLLNPTLTSVAETTYIDLPMEQPFFNVRSVQTQLSIYNGATVVLGGLITETRKTIDDKIPFLGDIPYLGRLFRSHSESSDKRNLLVFVTARLVDPAGRAVRMSGGESALMAGGGAAAGSQGHAAATSSVASQAAAPGASADAAKK